MLSDDLQLQAKTFVEDVERRLEEGKNTLGWLIQAYNWAGREGHLREIHRHTPTFSMEWLRSRITTTFNINPADLVRSMDRLGGESPEKAKKLCAIVDRVGAGAMCQADRQLTADQKKTFIDELPEANKVTLNLFREKVRQKYEEGLKKMGPKEVKSILSTGIAIDPRTENIALRKDLAILRKENASLRMEISSLKAENQALLRQMKKATYTLSPEERKAKTRASV